MGKRMNDWRKRKTAKVTVNGHKGRSQKGCFGGTSGFCASGTVYSKDLADSGKTVKAWVKEK